MLNSQQLDTVKGLIQNYKHYVVYYSGDYVDFEYGTDRNYDIFVYCGDDLTPTEYRNGFELGENVYAFRIFENKYIMPMTHSDLIQFDESHIVYSDFSGYSSLTYLPTKIQNFDFDSLLVGALLSVASIAILIKFFFGGK